MEWVSGSKMEMGSEFSSSGHVVDLMTCMNGRIEREFDKFALIPGSFLFLFMSFASLSLILILFMR